MPSPCTLTHIRSMSHPKPLLNGLRTSCIESDPETTVVRHQRLKLSHTSCPLVPSALCAHPHLSNSTLSFSLLHDLASSQVSSCLYLIGCPYHLPFPCPMPLTPILMPPFLMPPTSIPILSFILPLPHASLLYVPHSHPCTSYPIIDT